MKNNRKIKTLTLTVDEILALMSGSATAETLSAVAAAANDPEAIDPESVDTSARPLVEKMRTKAERLRIQREKRRLRKQQQAEPHADTVKPTTSSTASPARTHTIELTDTTVQQLLWFFKRKDTLKQTHMQEKHK